jgi:hypothetical protein
MGIPRAALGHVVFQFVETSSHLTRWLCFAAWLQKRKSGDAHTEAAGCRSFCLTGQAFN